MTEALYWAGLVQAPYQAYMLGRPSGASLTEADLDTDVVVRRGGVYIPVGLHIPQVQIEVHFVETFPAHLGKGHKVTTPMKGWALRNADETIVSRLLPAGAWRLGVDKHPDPKFDDIEHHTIYLQPLDEWARNGASDAVAVAQKKEATQTGADGTSPTPLGRWKLPAGDFTVSGSNRSEAHSCISTETSTTWEVYTDTERKRRKPDGLSALIHHATFELTPGETFVLRSADGADAVTGLVASPIRGPAMVFVTSANPSHYTLVDLDDGSTVKMHDDASYFTVWVHTL